VVCLKKIMKQTYLQIVFTFLFAFILNVGFSNENDSLYIKVHFLYGSKPKKEFEASENKWFGGIHGGHVGIEFIEGKTIDFVPKGEFHLFRRKYTAHSKFAIHSLSEFWGILGGVPSTVKKASIVIPITSDQKHKLDSIVQVYSENSPYDYAFFGMRCGAAAYEILGQLGIVKHYRIPRTYKKIFYPKKLRLLLFKKANQFNWTIEKTEGSETRNWENDK